MKPKPKKKVVHKKPAVKIKKPTGTAASKKGETGGSCFRKCKRGAKKTRKEAPVIAPTIDWKEDLDLNPQPPDQPSTDSLYPDSEPSSPPSESDSEISVKPTIGLNEKFRTDKYIESLIRRHIVKEHRRRRRGAFDEYEEDEEYEDDYYEDTEEDLGGASPRASIVYGGSVFDEGHWNKGKLLFEGVKKQPMNWEEEHLPPLRFVEYQPKVGRVYGNQVRFLFRWIVTILGIIGRLPLYSHKIKGKTTFEFKWLSRNGLFFYFNSFIMCAVVINCIVSMAGMIFDTPHLYSTPWKTWVEYWLEHRFFLHRNFIMMIVTFSMIINVLPGTWAIMMRPRFAAKYFQFWGDAIEILQMDVTRGARNFALVCLAIFLMLYSWMCVLAITNYAPVCGSVGSILAWAQGQIFKANILEWKYFQYARTFGTFSFMYILFITRIYLIVHIFITRMLAKAFRIWNVRLDRLLHFTDPFDSSNRMKSKWGLRNIYKEHVILCQLVDGANKLYAGIIDTFYYTATCSVSFELFYGAKAGSNSREFNEVRARDRYFMLTYFTLTFFLIWVVYWSASQVYYEAYQVMKSIRRKALFAEYTQDQALFLHSFVKSLLRQRPICMSGNGHFLLKPYFIWPVLGCATITLALLYQINPACNLNIVMLLPHEQKYLNMHRQQVLVSFWEGTRYTENVFPEIYRTLNITTSFYYKDYDYFAKLTGVLPRDPFYEHPEEQYPN